MKKRKLYLFLGRRRRNHRSLGVVGEGGGPAPTVRLTRRLHPGVCGHPRGPHLMGKRWERKSIEI
jgi:hypothetical protein